MELTSRLKPQRFLFLGMKQSLFDGSFDSCLGKTYLDFLNFEETKYRREDNDDDGDHDHYHDDDRSR